jgi:predicted nucleotidyltransferase
MGTGMTLPNIPLIPWLDPETAADVVDIITSLVTQHPEVVGVILFGSVARRESRPVDDPQPSDVDLLLLLDPRALHPSAYHLTSEQELALTHTIGEADYRHRTAPREVQVLFMDQDLGRWDSLFIENVARDGILLWARGPLPTPLAPVEERHRRSPLLAPTNA